MTNGANEAARRWRRKNPEKVNAYSRNFNRAKNGFSPDLFALTAAVQEQSCAICKIPFSELGKRAVHADHDHVTNEARGVLGKSCNLGLGYFKDSPKLFIEAMNYLSNPTAKEIKMLEPKIDELKAALSEATQVIKALTAAIGGMQASAPLANVAQITKPIEELVKEAPNEQSKSTTDTSQTSSDVSVKVVYNDVAKLVTQIAKNDLAKAKAALSRLGVKHGKELKETQWAEAVDYLSRVASGEVDPEVSHE